MHRLVFLIIISLIDGRCHKEAFSIKRSSSVLSCNHPIVNFTDATTSRFQECYMNMKTDCRNYNSVPFLKGFQHEQHDWCDMWWFLLLNLYFSMLSFFKSLYSAEVRMYKKVTAYQTTYNT